MPCDTSSINAFPPISPPSFGAFSPFQIPLPSLDLPSNLVEDIEALIQQFSALFPGSVFKPQVGFSAKTVLDMVMHILSEIAPFLSLYNFFMSLLNIILCLIEILCSLLNPFALAQKLLKLFTVCIPAFLLLFPWLALIAMILALLLLILALIEYIIATILAVILAIIANLEVLAAGLSLQDAQSTLAALQKIVSLTCFIQNLLAVLIAIAAIINIIKSLAQFAGGTICDGSDNTGCCSALTCPDFIKLTPDGISVKNGKLVYYHQIGVDTAKVFATLFPPPSPPPPPGSPGIANLFAIPPVRSERWQLFEADFPSSSTYQVNAIIEEVFDPLNILAGDLIGNIFWKDGLELTASAPKTQSLYTADIRLEVDPFQFGIVDSLGKRFFQIKDAIVVRKPYLGIMNQDNIIELTNLNGTLNIEGGLFFEDDGTTPYKIAGKQATLNTFIHQTPMLAGTPADLPTTDDSITFDNITFTWKPNAAGLAGYGLVTIGCIPAINIEKAVQNSIILAEGIAPVIQKINPVVPDIDKAISCTNVAIATFKKNVSIAGAAEFQAAITSCLGALRDETKGIICAAITAAVSQFKSTMALDTDVQFTTREITVTVVLKDPTGTTISENIPATCAAQVEGLLNGEVTFGQISPFKYNGHGFNATITSADTGAGTLEVNYNGKIFNTVIPGENGKNSKIITNVLDYQFITGVTEPVVRRDDTDVSRD